MAVIKAATFFTAWLLAGCQAAPKINKSEDVRIIFPPVDLTLCDFKSDVIGSQGNWITYWFTSDEELVKGMMNDMRNEAINLGANTVVWRQTLYFNLSATTIGQAYKCPY